MDPLEEMRTQLAALSTQVRDTNRGVNDALASRYGGGNAQRVIKAFQKNDRTEEETWGPMKSSGCFYKAIKDVAVRHNNNWRIHEHTQTNYGNLPGMKAFGEFLSKTTMKGVPTGMNEMQGQDGAFLIPPEFSNQLLMRTYENDLLSRCYMMPMTSNMLEIPAINETSRANGSRFGGVWAKWRQEGGNTTPTKPSFDQVQIKPDSLSLYIQLTNEFIEDASVITIDQHLNFLAEQELTFVIGDAIVNGTGTTQMQGIMNSPAMVTVAKDAGQLSKTLTSSNIITMWSRLHHSCRKNAIWLYDQTIEPALFTMTVGSAGANLAVFMPPGGLSDKPYATILGRPALPVEFCQQLGTPGDIILWDPGTYIVGMRQTMQTASSIHVLFDTNESMYRFITRIDGKNWWLTGVTPKSGGPVQSCQVNLAAR